LQEKFYRKVFSLSKVPVANMQTEFYSIDWKEIDLQGSLVSGASSGGAIGDFFVLSDANDSYNKG